MMHSISHLFHCHEDLLPLLLDAAEAAKRSCGAPELWVYILRALADQIGAHSPQGVNLTKLLQHTPHCLPTWALCSSVLSGTLTAGQMMADGNQVFLTDAPNTPGTIMHFLFSDGSAILLGPDEQENAAKLQQAKARAESLQTLLRNGATAAAAKAGRAFLTLEPPLPVALLQLLGTADLLSLSQVCRELHVASYELLCREEVAWQTVQAEQGDSSSGYSPMAPYAAANLPLKAAAAETAASDDSSEDESEQQGKDSMGRGARRYMRCLSLLCGSPEAAAAALAQEQQAAEEARHRNSDIKGSIAWGMMTAHADTLFFYYDGISGIFKQASNGVGDSCRTAAGSLRIVRGADLPGFMQRTQQLTPQPPEDEDERYRNDPIYFSFQEEHRSAVMDMARDAQRLGHALCLMNNVDSPG